MLKCKVDKEKGIVSIKASGSAHTMAVEILAIIASVYENLDSMDNKVAELFQFEMITSLMDLKSPVWATDRKEQEK